jgi:hypothetical protein
VVEREDCNLLPRYLQNNNKPFGGFLIMTEERRGRSALSLSNVMILRTIGNPEKLSTLLKAMHLGDQIELYEEEQVNGVEYSQTTIATIPVDLSDWNREES